MKLTKIVLPLVLALAAVMATTGCKHGPTKMTNIPERNRMGIRGEEPGTTLPQPPPFDTQPMPTANPNTTVAPGGGELPHWRPEDMKQDRNKLAAYMVHFKFDSAVVQDSEQPNVASVAQQMMSDKSGYLLIEGHCDERGTEEYNRSLGERRALALREALVKDGVEAERIQTRSYGKDKPLDPGHDESAWAKNRRGEFIWCTQQ